MLILSMVAVLFFAADAATANAAGEFGAGSTVEAISARPAGEATLPAEGAYLVHQGRSASSLAVREYGPSLRWEIDRRKSRGEFSMARISAANVRWPVWLLHPHGGQPLFARLAARILFCVWRP